MFFNYREKEQGELVPLLLLTCTMMRMLHWSFYLVTYIPILSYGQKLWVLAERMSSWIQVTEIRFLQRIAGLLFSDRMRKSVIQEGRRFEPVLLHIKRSQLRSFGHLKGFPMGVFWVRCSWHVLPKEDPELPTQERLKITETLHFSAGLGKP